MEFKEQYIKANVPITVRNAYFKCAWYGMSFKNALHNSTDHNHSGVVGIEEYRKAVSEYVDNMKKDDKNIIKWIEAVKWHYLSGDWKIDLKEEFMCKNEQDLLVKIKKLINE